MFPHQLITLMNETVTFWDEIKSTGNCVKFKYY